MSVPDPVTTGVALAGALQLAKQAQEFLAAATGHPGESVGTILGNITRQRVQNLERVVSKSHFILLNIGLTATDVRLKIIHPLLDAASLEEDPELQALWANLIANAADPRGAVIVRESFAPALRQLTSSDVRFLDRLYDVAISVDAGRIYLFRDGMDIGSYGVLWEIFHMVTVGPLNSSDELAGSWSAFEITLDTLRRTSILKPHTQVMQGNGYSDPVPHDAELVTKERHLLTPFGYELVRACRPPGGLYD